MSSLGRVGGPLGQAKLSHRKEEVKTQMGPSPCCSVPGGWAVGCSHGTFCRAQETLLWAPQTLLDQVQCLAFVWHVHSLEGTATLVFLRARRADTTSPFRLGKQRLGNMV